MQLQASILSSTNAGSRCGLRACRSISGDRARKLISLEFPYIAWILSFRATSMAWDFQKYRVKATKCFWRFFRLGGLGGDCFFHVEKQPTTANFQTTQKETHTTKENNCMNSKSPEIRPCAASWRMDDRLGLARICLEISASGHQHTHCRSGERKKET